MIARLPKPMRQFPPIHVSLTLGVLTLSAQAQTAALPQISRETYARAEALDRRSAAAKVRNVLVVPHWIGTSDEFWYRRETASGHEFVVVHAANGGSRPAFDHAAVAKALASIAGRPVSPQRLPFDAFAFVGGREAIRIEVDARTYDC